MWPYPDEDWPTAAEAAESRLFSPVRLGPLTAYARTWIPAMVPWRATEDGYVTPQVLDWYGRFAEGQPGVMVVEATGIRDIKSGPLLRVGHDRFIPGLEQLVDVVRERSGGRTRLLIQLIDFLTIRRRPEPRRFFERYLGLQPRHRERLADVVGDDGWLEAPEEDVRAGLAELQPADWERVLDDRDLESLRMGYRERVTDLHLPHVRELPRVLPGLFADAASRARSAGFHGVELHYAHAYTMASFLSRTNDRDDGYGGDAAGRVRLPREVLRAVRRRVGEDWCVGVRFLGDEVVEGGSEVEEACEYARVFARDGVDFLSVSKGGKFEDARQPRVGEAAYPYTGPSGLECMPTVRLGSPGPFGRNLHLATAVRRAVRSEGRRVPVVAAGGLCSFRQMESALARREADVMAAARQSLADPDWWVKMALGRGTEIRRCLYTNYCEGLDQRHREVTCQLWDRELSAEGDLSMSSDGRRRLVAPPWEGDHPSPHGVRD